MTSRTIDGGVFISFEGGDGAGKSTHMAFLCQTLEELGYTVLKLREPGATKTGEALRSIVLDVENDNLSPRAELLIFEAARAQMVDELVKPALSAGNVVICDRFFDSTVAYQGFGRGLDLGVVSRANDFAIDGVVPQRTVLMLAPSAAEGLKRAQDVAPADRMELSGEDFHQRVLQGFAASADANPQRIRIVVSQQKRSETAKLVFSQVADLFPGLDDLLADDGFFARLDVEGAC